MIWTKEEIEILRKNYLKAGNDYNFLGLNKSPNAIRIKASRLGIKRLTYRKYIKLSNSEDQILLGGLLGDLYCAINISSKNARIEGAHCKKQESYLLWKVNMLESLTFNLRRTNMGYLFFKSRSYPCLNYYHNLFYKDRKKQINKSILNKVNELGLSIWYMDDGSYEKKGKYSNLYTNGFTYDENFIIKNWFEEKWGIFPKIRVYKDPKRYPGKVWYFLKFGVFETKKLIKIVEPYIHPSMKYKIGVVN